MINKNQVRIQTNQLSANYEHSHVSYDGVMFDNIVLKNTNVCVLPFETESSGKIIHYLYLYKYYDFLKAETRVSTLLYKNDEERDESNLDTVIRCIGDTMRIPITNNDVNRVFYLGEIELNNLISGGIPCYGVNVTGLAKEMTYPISDKFESTLDRVMYSNVLRGTSQDYIVASSVFMLLSYLS